MDTYIGLFNGDLIQYKKENERIEVVEITQKRKRKGKGDGKGAGKCSFVVKSPAIFMKAKSGRELIWSFSDQSYAEAAFVTKAKDGRVKLHIIEMKSKVSLKTFSHVMEQWKGMYLAALSVLGVLKIPEPDRVFVYLAYTSEVVSLGEGSSLVLNKTLVGGELPPVRKEWETERIKMPHGLVADVKKGVRYENSDGSGFDCDFGEVD